MEEFEEIYNDSVFPQFNNNRKKEFIKNYNEAIEEMKEQHNFIVLVTTQIEDIPLRTKWLFPLA
ncbi:MAG: hypothetical protein IPK10_16235 [Bacteroidetes bacterium]|nr:hypothetical protein [Bacteroidota bacterium]